MCTDFILPFDAQKPTIISARTMDFAESPDESYVTILSKVPVGLEFKASAPDKKPGLTWKNKYGFVGLAQIQEASADEACDVTTQPFCDGMNEKGLSAAGLWLSYTDYLSDPKPEDYQRCLSEEMLISYLLGVCASVDEVRKCLADVVVWFSEKWEKQFPFHLAIHDSQGKSLVVEFINGETCCYVNDEIGVLSNGPTFDWQVVNFNYCYRSLTNRDNPDDRYVERLVDGSGHYDFGQGNGYQYEVLASGMAGLPGDSRSPSRFVRAGKLRSCVPETTDGQPSDTRDAVQYALQILGRISVCDQEVLVYFNSQGEASDPRNTYNPSLWGLVRDHSHLTLYYLTHLNHNLQAIKLDELDFTDGTTSQTSMANDSWYNDSTAELLTR